MYAQDLPPGADPEKKKELMAEENRYPVPYVVSKNPESFQARVYPWTMKTFGPSLTHSIRERRQRFGEEAIEFLQSLGATYDEIVQMVGHVMSRPVGNPKQEAAGVQVCLAAACNVMNINMDECREEEFERCKEKVDVIREKNLTKPTF